MYEYVTGVLSGGSVILYRPEVIDLAYLAQLILFIFMCLLKLFFRRRIKTRQAKNPQSVNSYLENTAAPADAQLRASVAFNNVPRGK